MASGDRELMKAFEEVTTNNVKAVLSFSKETRNLVRELEAKVTLLDGMLRQQSAFIESLKLQLSNIQTKIYSGGTD